MLVFTVNHLDSSLDWSIRFFTPPVKNGSSFFLRWPSSPDTYKTTRKPTDCVCGAFWKKKSCTWYLLLWCQYCSYGCWSHNVYIWMHFWQQSVGMTSTRAPDSCHISWQWCNCMEMVVCSTSCYLLNVMVTSHCWPFLYNYPRYLIGIAWVLMVILSCSCFTHWCVSFIFVLGRGWGTTSVSKSVFHFFVFLFYAPVIFSTLIFHVTPHELWR